MSVQGLKPGAVDAAAGGSEALVRALAACFWASLSVDVELRHGWRGQEPVLLSAFVCLAASAMQTEDWFSRGQAFKRVLRMRCLSLLFWCKISPNREYVQKMKLGPPRSK